jgi:hypothetical protein
MILVFPTDDCQGLNLPSSPKPSYYFSDCHSSWMRMSIIMLYSHTFWHFHWLFACEMSLRTNRFMKYWTLTCDFMFKEVAWIEPCQSHITTITFPSVDHIFNFSGGGRNVSPWHTEHLGVLIYKCASTFHQSTVCFCFSRWIIFLIGLLASDAPWV